MGRVSGPSCGGSVITAAGTDNRVAGLVYIAALPPTLTKRPRASRRSFPSPMSLNMSRSRTGASGCVLRASHASRAIFRSKNRSSSGRPTTRRRPVQPHCSWSRLEVEAASADPARLWHTAAPPIRSGLWAPAQALPARTVQRKISPWPKRWRRTVYRPLHR